jgi:hypothetical protein
MLVCYSFNSVVKQLHSSKALAMYRFDPKRFDLAIEFYVNPLGEHSPDLQYLLHLMRTPSCEHFHVLLNERPNERWRLAVMTPGAPCAPFLTEHTFTSLEQAEWHVFKLRWTSLGGEDLALSFAAMEDRAPANGLSASLQQSLAFPPTAR